MYKDQELNIINIYAPTVPRERKDFLKTLCNFKTGDTNLILAGDFNCVEDPTFDKLGGNPANGTAGMDELLNFTTNHDLIDVWRDQHPGDRIYTWSNRDFTLRSRLDRWYIPQESTKTATSCIRACPHSDHSAVEVVFCLTNSRQRGKGVWKFNNLLLDDKAFLREIKYVYNFWKACSNEYPDTLVWWDEVKAHFKKVAITHSIRKIRNREKLETSLRQKLTKLQNELHPDVNAISTIQQHLRELVTKRLEGAKVRSRASWLEEGEKPTRFFFNLEQTKQKQVTITKLKTTRGEITSQKDILQATADFYQKLYTDEEVDAETQTWFLEQLDRTLAHHAKNSCEGPITRKELDEAVRKMNVNKSPGPDGLTTEFYLTFWHLIADDLVEAFNRAFEGERLSPTQTSSLLRLLFKKGDRNLLKNWRPISLLNTDYKLLATAIANRLRPTLPASIHPDQTCGIPERSIFDNTLRLRDMIHEANTRRNNLILVNLDQEKAFDRVNRKFLEKILIKMNYGPSFVQWIRTLYAGANCKIINNGHLSDTVYLERGVRQGCPLSPLLYTLIIETLVTAIRHDKRIEGIPVPGSQDESKISAYADDGTLTLKDDRSVARAFEVIQQYEAASGSKLNMEKTEGIYVGQQAGRTTGPVPITWKTDAITVLGTKMGNNMEQDWQKQLDKLEKRFDAWKHRSLTILGKAVLIRTYAIATIVYLASIFPIPPNITVKAQRLCFQFLWQNRNELVSRATCHLSLGDGGLGIPDLEDVATISLVKWIKKIVDQKNNMLWTHHGRYWTGQSLGLIKTSEWLWLRSNTKPHGDPEHTPPWYEKLLHFCRQHKDKVTTTPDHHLTAKVMKTWHVRKHTPRCETEWKRYVALPLNFEQVWPHIWGSEANNPVKEFLWRLAHRVLPTKSLLRHWGVPVQPQCPFCNLNEDMHHALISCQRARQLWQDLRHLISAIAGTNIPMRLETIAFGWHLPKETNRERLTYYVITLAAHTLWATRNKAITGMQKQDSLKQSVIQKIKGRVKAEELININRVADFWGFGQIILSRTNDETVFHI